MVWPKKKVVEPWTYDWKRDPCDCSQSFKLAVTGMSEKQGPTHYCPGCRWAFWTIEMKPSADQIALAKKDDPKACEASMKYTKLRTKPVPTGGTTPENLMIDQLGKHGLTFLTTALNQYWAVKYCEKYPNSERAKALKQMEEEHNRRYGIN